MVVCSKSCQFWPNRWFLVSLHEMRHFLQLFSGKFIEMQRHGSLLEKLQRVGHIDDFSCFFTNWSTFCNLLLKSSSKHQNMVVCYKKCHSFGQIDEFSCFSTEWGNFFNSLLKSSGKCQERVVFSKSRKFWPNRWFLMLSHEMRHLLQLFPEKFIEMQRHGSLFEKLQSFGQIDDFSCFFTNWATFCKLLLKSSPKHQNMVVC